MSIIDYGEYRVISLNKALDTVLMAVRSGQMQARIMESGLSGEDRVTVSKINELLNISEQRSKQVRYDEDALKEAVRSIKTMTDNVNLLKSGNLSINTKIPTTISQNGSREISKSILELSDSINTLRDNINIFCRENIKFSNEIKKGNLSAVFNNKEFPGIYGEVAENQRDMSRIIDSSLSEIITVLNNYNESDFTARIDPAHKISGKYESVALLTDGVGTLVGKILSNISEKASSLSENTEQANASVKVVAMGAEKVTANSHAVSENTETSNSGVQQVLRAMEDLAVTVGDVSQKADSVSRLANESNNLAQEGSDLARKVEAGMTSITTNTDITNNLIEEIQGEMKRINEIVRLITEIANQTNLLALNAAIEAARAGEMGRGFAVVASEVKALALESRQSADKITDLITSLQKKSLNAAEGVALAMTAVTNGSNLLTDTLNVFTRMVQSVEEISSNIEQVAGMNQEQAATVEQITSSMHEVGAMLKDTADEASGSAETTNNTNKSVKELIDVMEKVTVISEDILNSLDNVKV